MTDAADIERADAAIAEQVGDQRGNTYWHEAPRLPLDEIVNRVNTLSRMIVSNRISQGILLLEARHRIEQEGKMTWTAWCAANLTIGERTVRRNIALVKHPDGPENALAAERKAHAEEERQRRARERQSTTPAASERASASTWLPSQSRAQSQGKPDSRESAPKPGTSRPATARDYQAELIEAAVEAERHLKCVQTADTLEAAFELAGIADAFAGEARDIRRSAIAVGRDSIALGTAEARAAAAADAAEKAANAELAGSLAGQIGTALDNLAGLDGATTPLQLEGLCRLGEVCEAIIIFDGASDGDLSEPRIWLRRVEESDAKALAERIAKQYVPEDAMTDVWAHDDDGKPVQVLNLKPDQAA